MLSPQLHLPSSFASSGTWRVAAVFRTLLKRQCFPCSVGIPVTVMAWCDDLVNTHFSSTWRAWQCLSGTQWTPRSHWVDDWIGVRCEGERLMEQSLAFWGVCLLRGMMPATVVLFWGVLCGFPGKRCFKHTDCHCPRCVSPVTSFLVQPHSCTPSLPQASLEQARSPAALLARILTYITGW